MLRELWYLAHRWGLVADAAALGSTARAEAEALTRALAHLHRSAEKGDLDALKAAGEAARFKLGAEDPIRSRTTDLERLCAKIDRTATAMASTVEPKRRTLDVDAFARAVVTMVVHRDRSPFAKRLREIGRLHVQRQDEATTMLATMIRHELPTDARGVVVTFARTFGMPEKEIRSLFDYQRKRQRRAP